MKRLAIVGAGGHGRVIADAAQCSGWSAIDFYDDAWPGIGPSTGPWSIVGNIPLLFAQLGDYQGVIVGIGNHQRSEERRVGKECVSTCRSRWSASHSKKKPT